MKKFTPSCFFSFSLSAFLAQALLVFTLTLACAVQLMAQAPRISVQGTLKSANGTPASDGQQEITFRLYDAPSGGMPLWEETAIVDVVGGIYSHYLGSVAPLVPAHFAQTLYLGVRVGTYELVPRNQLAYAPYAFSVNVAQKVVCSGAVGDVKYSVLNPTEFALRNGNCWVPMDGRSLATNDSLRVIKGWTALPDAGGLFFRSQEFSGGADNDPNRTSATTIATLQQDDLESHNHTMVTAGDHTHTVRLGYEGDDEGTGGSHNEWTNNPNLNRDITGFGGSVSTDGAHTHTINNTGGTETRPKNLNLWVYIRIN
ncbi:MAG: hypothetical protein ACKVU2_10215 [Saprospiraceae bacterium]